MSDTTWDTDGQDVFYIRADNGDIERCRKVGDSYEFSAAPLAFPKRCEINSSLLDSRIWVTPDDIIVFKGCSWNTMATDAPDVAAGYATLYALNRARFDGDVLTGARVHTLSAVFSTEVDVVGHEAFVRSVESVPNEAEGIVRLSLDTGAKDFLRPFATYEQRVGRRVGALAASPEAICYNVSGGAGSDRTRLTCLQKTAPCGEYRVESANIEFGRTAFPPSRMTLSGTSLVFVNHHYGETGHLGSEDIYFHKLPRLF